MAKYVKYNLDILASAIVAQAVEDYYDVCMPYSESYMKYLCNRKMRKWSAARQNSKEEALICREEIDNQRLAEKKSIEDFFHSDWYTMLCGNVDPDFLIRTTIERRRRGENPLRGDVDGYACSSERLSEAGS